MKYMGYLFIIALELLLGTIFAVTIYLDLKRIKKKFDREVNKAKANCYIGSLTMDCVKAANYIVELTNKSNSEKPYSERVSLTVERIQKLLYLSDAEYMMLYGQAMFEDEFRAWPRGPVIPTVYYVYGMRRDGEFRVVDMEDELPLEKEKQEIIERIFECTYSVNIEDLREICCAVGSPWACAYNDSDTEHYRQIIKSKTKEYYKRRPVTCCIMRRKQ